MFALLLLSALFKKLRFNFVPRTKNEVRMTALCSPSFRCFVISLFRYFVVPFYFYFERAYMEVHFFHHAGPREESTFPRRFGTHPAC